MHAGYDTIRAEGQKSRARGLGGIPERTDRQKRTTTKIKSQTDRVYMEGKREMDTPIGI